MSTDALNSVSSAGDQLKTCVDNGDYAGAFYQSQVIVVRFGNPSQKLPHYVRQIINGALPKLIDAPSRHKKNIFNDFRNIIIQCLKELNEVGNTSYTSYMNLLLTLQAKTLSEQGPLMPKNPAWPDIIHLETISKCNASCSFCPYPDLPRNGQRMSDKDINKIREDLKIIPKEQSIIFQPFKVSEPFLENRLAAICEAFWQDHPSWTFQIITNGSVFNAKVLHELYELAVAGMTLNIKFSLNEVDEFEYKKLMNLDLVRTLNSIEKIINLFEALASVSMAFTRVSTSADGDQQYLNFCKKYSPRVSAGLLKKNDWLGTVDSNDDPRLALAMLGCKRWTDLSITSSGELALCCMDSTATLKIGNALNENVLDLFRMRSERFVPSSGKRGDAPEPCRSCTYYQYQPSKLLPFSIAELREQFG